MEQNSGESARKPIAKCEALIERALERDWLAAMTPTEMETAMEAKIKTRTKTELAPAHKTENRTVRNPIALAQTSTALGYTPFR